MDTGGANADVILGPGIERALVHEHQRLVIVDDIGGLVVEGGVGRDMQTARGITVVAGELLLHDKPVTVLAVAYAVVFTISGDIDLHVTGRSLTLGDHTSSTGNTVPLVPLPLSLKPLPCSSCDGFWL